MAIKARKESRRDNSKLPTSGQENYHGRFELLLVLLYLGVDLIPQLGSIEVMGPQWLYLSVLESDFYHLYIFKHNSTLSKLYNLLSKNTISLLYIAVFAICGISILFALNPNRVHCSLQQIHYYFSLIFDHLHPHLLLS
jgi:hypothetical protein